MKAFTDDQIQAALAAVTGWKLLGKEIQREFPFPKYQDSLRFFQTVAEHAERVDHHPDALVQYGKVTLTLSSHDAGGLTQRDFDFAGFVDQLAQASAKK